MRNRTRILWASFPLLVLGFLIILNLGCNAPLKQLSLQENLNPVLTDNYLDLARNYAPYLYHEIHPTKGRQDIPTRVDFDGDLRGDNNWDHFPSHALPPTVYYMVLETETHYFLTYHLFHPRDWSFMHLGVHTTHENDGENLQVVVEKASGSPVLLFTQAHYCGRIYSNEQEKIKSGEREIRAPVLWLEGRHAAVFVESCGHGIYGALDSSSEVTVDESGAVRFEGFGMIFRPASAGEEIREPELIDGAIVPYQLESTTKKLWPGLRDQTLVGEGGLFDRPYAYQDERVKIGVPRYYEADFFSGPLGPDRGISPFAVDIDWEEGTLGALFFDPARRYRECLRIEGPWSLNYVNYPFNN